MTHAVLSTSSLGKSYGAVRVLHDVSFDVAAGARHAIIGPNGAGKSTLFGILSGRVPSSRGAIRYRGKDVTTLNEIHRARLGIQQTLQHSSLFGSMSVVDNVALAVQRARGIGGRWWGAATRYENVTAGSLRYVDQVGLGDHADALVSELSHGERRQLEVAIALAAEPALLMLDEPTAGMSPAETARFVALVRCLPEEMTVIFVEHDIDVVMTLATAITVLNLGELIATATPGDILANEEVQSAYLSGSSREDIFIDSAGGRS
jgi:branched-chain amino acid transport system ATP-binding protein